MTTAKLQSIRQAHWSPSFEPLLRDPPVQQPKLGSMASSLTQHVTHVFLSTAGDGLSEAEREACVTLYRCLLARRRFVCTGNTVTNSPFTPSQVLPKNYNTPPACAPPPTPAGAFCLFELLPHAFASRLTGHSPADVTLHFVKGVFEARRGETALCAPPVSLPDFLQDLDYIRMACVLGPHFAL